MLRRARGAAAPGAPVYEVRRDNTLGSIARLFRTTIAALRTWNPRLSGNRIIAGQCLTV
jgi:LysM repeat protein